MKKNISNPIAIASSNCIFFDNVNRKIITNLFLYTCEKIIPKQSALNVLSNVEYLCLLIKHCTCILHVHLITYVCASAVNTPSLIELIKL